MAQHKQSRDRIIDLDLVRAEKNPTRSTHMPLDDEHLRLGVSMIVQWMFGPVGLQVADYAGILAVGHVQPQRGGKHGTAGYLPTAVKSGRRGQELQSGKSTRRH